VTGKLLVPLLKFAIKPWYPDEIFAAVPPDRDRMVVLSSSDRVQMN
jgi:hypothetical protein